MDLSHHRPAIRHPRRAHHEGNPPTVPEKIGYPNIIHCLLYNLVVSVHIAEVTVDAQGRVVLDHLPFRPGDKVDVVVRSHEAPQKAATDLRGSVLRYDNPFDPVAMEDWEIDR